MELSKEVHGLLDRIKRLSNAQKTTTVDTYQSMNTSYSIEPEIDFTQDDIIKLDDFDTSDRETWLYVSEESNVSSAVESDWFNPDLNKSTEDDQFLDSETDKYGFKKNVDTRTFTRPKKRMNRPSLESISDNYSERSFKVHDLEQLKIPEHPFNNFSTRNDISISTGPLHFKLSDPVMNHSFDKILLTASDGYDSFTNMSPPSLMNSLCSSTFNTLDTSIQMNQSTSFNNETFMSESKDPQNINLSQESFQEEMPALHITIDPNLSSDSNKMDSTMVISSSKNRLRRLINSEKSNDLNVTSTPNRARNLTQVIASPSLNITYEKDNLEDTTDSKGSVNLNTTYQKNNENKSLNSTFALNQEKSINTAESGNEKSLNSTYVAEKTANSPELNSTYTPMNKSLERNCTFTPHDKSVEKNSSFTPMNKSLEKNSTFTPFDKPLEKNSTFMSVDKSLEKNSTFTPMNKTLERNSTPSKLVSPKPVSPERNLYANKPIRRSPEINQSYTVLKSKSEEDEEFVKASSIEKGLNSYALRKANSTEKSINYATMLKSPSKTFYNGKYANPSLGTFTKKPRNITNLPESLKKSCPDINRTFQSHLDKSFTRTFQKLSDSQPNLTKEVQQTILNQSMELMNTDVYEGYHNARTGSTDSLDDKSSSVSSSSKESTSKILNMGDLDNLARLQEQSLQQIMSTPKPKTGIARFWDADAMSPIHRQEDYLSEDSDVSEACVTARSGLSKLSGSSSRSGSLTRLSIPRAGKIQDIGRLLPPNKPEEVRQTNRQVPTMIVKPLEVDRTFKMPLKPAPQPSLLQRPRPVQRASGLPRPSTGQHTGIPRPASRIPGPRLARPQLVRPSQRPKSDWMDGCY